MSNWSIQGGRGSYAVQPDTIRTGGQAQVWRAMSPEGSPVAIKVARGRGRAGAWMDGERDTLLRIQARHGDAAPWIVPILDHGLTPDDRRFIVLPWFEATLHDVLDGLPIEDRLRLAEGAARAVVLLHQSAERLSGALLHRDIKPTNFLVDRIDGRFDVVLSDLGGVKEARLASAVGNTGLCTQFYAPLEQMLPLVLPPDPSADVHALAVTVYQCVADAIPAAMYTRELLFTPDGHRLIELFRRSAKLTPDEHAEYDALRRDRVSRFVDLGGAEPLFPRDQGALGSFVEEGLRGRVGDAMHVASAVCARLLPTLERALHVDPEKRLGDARAVLAACEAAREIVEDALAEQVLEIPLDPGPAREVTDPGRRRFPTLGPDLAAIPGGDTNVVSEAPPESGEPRRRAWLPVVVGAGALALAATWLLWPDSPSAVAPPPAPELVATPPPAPAPEVPATAEVSVAATAPPPREVVAARPAPPIVAVEPPEPPPVEPVAEPPPPPFDLWVSSPDCLVEAVVVDGARTAGFRASLPASPGPHSVSASLPCQPEARLTVSLEASAEGWSVRAIDAGGGSRSRDSVAAGSKVLLVVDGGGRVAAVR